MLHYDSAVNQHYHPVYSMICNRDSKDWWITSLRIKAYFSLSLSHLTNPTHSGYLRLVRSSTFEHHWMLLVSRNCQTSMRHSPSWIPLRFVGILITHYLTNPSWTQSDLYAVEWRQATPLHSASSSEVVRENFPVSGKKQRHGCLDHLRWRSWCKRAPEIPFKTNSQCLWRWDMSSTQGKFQFPHLRF